MFIKLCFCVMVLVGGGDVQADEGERKDDTGGCFTKHQIITFGWWHSVIFVLLSSLYVCFIKKKKVHLLTKRKRSFSIGDRHFMFNSGERRLEQNGVKSLMNRNFLPCFIWVQPSVRSHQTAEPVTPASTVASRPFRSSHSR